MKALIKTQIGVKPVDIVKEFTCVNRKFFVHESDDEFHVTDYITGYKVCSGKNKETSVNSAVRKIKKNKYFDY